MTNKQARREYRRLKLAGKVGSRSFRDWCRAVVTIDDAPLSPKLARIMAQGKKAA